LEMVRLHDSNTRPRHYEIIAVFWSDRSNVCGIFLGGVSPCPKLVVVRRKRVQIDSARTILKAGRCNPAANALKPLRPERPKSLLAAGLRSKEQCSNKPSGGWPVKVECSIVRRIIKRIFMMRVSKIVAVASVVVFAPGFSLAEVPLPHQKSGLWESSMTMEGHPFTTQSCITEDSAAKMSVFSSQLRQNNCSSSSITHDLDGSWTSTSTCKFGGTVHTSHARVTGDFNSKITMVLTRDGSNTPETQLTMAWIGACKPGMIGGDVIMSNGMKMNVLNSTMSGGPPH
jgi:Protein of unknown function (DUF3617)